MKRFAPALMMLSAGLAGCQAVDSRVAVRGDIVSESQPIVSDQESPRPLPIVVRWQNMVARVRENIQENNRRPERSSRENVQGLELTSVPMTVVRQGEAREESQSSSVVQSGGMDRSEKVKTLPAGQGLDAATGEYVDMFKAGIIDPAKVTRSALQNAASIAGLFLTTEAVVAEKPEKEKAPAAPGGGDMDF